MMLLSAQHMYNLVESRLRAKKSTLLMSVTLTRTGIACSVYSQQAGKHGVSALQISAMLCKIADPTSVNSQVATLPLSTSTKNKDSRERISNNAVGNGDNNVTVTSRCIVSTIRCQSCLTVYVCVGGVSMECVQSIVESQLLKEYLPLGLGLALLVAAVVLLLVFRWRQILNEIMSARLNRIKRG